MLCFLSIVLLLLATSHFVDDFYLIEPTCLAVSGFDRALGLRMKEEKAKPPAKHIRLLGLDWIITEAVLAIHPGQDRVDKVTSLLQDSFAKGVMSQHEAAHLAGKLAFVCSWVFGEVGRALLKAVYSRQHHGIHGPWRLQPALRAALETLLLLLPAIKPAQLPLTSKELSSKVAVLCADAFVTFAGGQRRSQQCLKEGVALQDLRVRQWLGGNSRQRS